MINQEIIKAETQKIAQERQDEWEQFLLDNPELEEAVKNEKWEDFLSECSEIAISKIEKTINPFMIDYEQIRINYDPAYFKPEEIFEIKKSAAEDIKKSLKYRFVSHCTNFSYSNELSLEIMFHGILSLITKDQNIYLEGRKIFGKIHFLWMQQSGSGKGEAFKEIARILNEYNAMVENPLKIVWLDGSETIESFYNSFATGKSGYDLNNPVKGLFETADLILIEECSYIFVEKRGQKQTKSEVFLKALEDQPLYKKLASWNGKSTITYPNFVMFSSSRVVPEVQEAIASSGLLQRQVPQFRNITAEVRLEMNKKNVQKKFFPVMDETGFQKERIMLADEFYRLHKEINLNNQFTFENKEECFALISQNNDKMQKELYNTITRQEHRMIAEAFISRFVDRILVFSIHNAIMRGSRKINVSDIQISCEIAERIFRNLYLWIEETIDENRFLKKRRQLFQKYIREWFKHKESYSLEEFAELVVTRTSYSRSYAYNLIEKFSVGKRSLLKKTNNRIYLNNKR